MSDTQKIVDLDEESLPDSVRQEIAHMVRLGYKRRHLVLLSSGTVHFDKTLAQDDAFVSEFSEFEDEDETTGS